MQRVRWGCGGAALFWTRGDGLGGFQYKNRDFAWVRGLGIVGVGTALADFCPQALAFLPGGESDLAGEASASNSHPSDWICPQIQGPDGVGRSTSMGADDDHLVRIAFVRQDDGSLLASLPMNGGHE